jgi:hypothetical protein
MFYALMINLIYFLLAVCCCAFVAAVCYCVCGLCLWGLREAYRNGSLTQEGVKRLFKVCNLVQLCAPSCVVLCCVVHCGTLFRGVN